LRKEIKRRSVLTTLVHDMQGTAAQKLALFGKLKAAGGFANEDPTQLQMAEKMLRRAATEKESG
jgi:hypothetical protein